MDPSRTSFRFQMACLVVGQCLFAASTFFWTEGGRLTATAGMLIVPAMALWGIGFVGLFTLLERRFPWYARLGLLYALYGCIGGAGFGFEGIFSDYLHYAGKLGVDAQQQLPMPLNVALFWAGPAFPLSLIVLGVVLWRSRHCSAWVALSFAAGGAAFPVSRIVRLASLAHAADFVLLAPAIALFFTRVETAGPPHDS